MPRRWLMAAVLATAMGSYGNAATLGVGDGDLPGVLGAKYHFADTKDSFVLTITGGSFKTYGNFSNSNIFNDYWNVNITLTGVIGNYFDQIAVDSKSVHNPTGPVFNFTKSLTYIFNSTSDSLHDKHDTGWDDFTGRLTATSHFYNITGWGVDIRGVHTVPEPSTWALMLAGLAGIGAARYMRSRKGHAQERPLPTTRA